MMRTGLAASICILVSESISLGATGTFLVPCVTGRPEVRAFAGHPGWVDVYAPGYGKSASARIGEDGRFTVPDPQGPACLVAMFDRIEPPPVIAPRWPSEPGGFDVLIATEYACVPEGGRDLWDKQYKVRATDFYQSFVPRCTQIYGLSVFDGPRIVDWGNKINVGFYADGPQGKAMAFKDQGSPEPGVQGHWDELSCGASNHELPRVGWRHGDVEVTPGRTYAVRASGYRSRGGKNLELDAYVRPDRNDGYREGRAFADGKPLDGDLCCLIFGNGNGQIIETQIRTEEWEIFIPPHRPTQAWGQSFVTHGVSLAGVSFWASSGGSEQLMCEVHLHEDGPWGREIKPAKVARSHESPVRPIIRYPDAPKPLPGCEAFYKLPCQFFQVAYQPDEVALNPGRTYYVELTATRPLLIYADGDYYGQGFAYYEGLKVERQEVGRATKHSSRWTLAMNIVTYMNAGGKPLVPATQPIAWPTTSPATQPATQPTTTRPAARPTTPPQ